ncbi:hypothetical protein PV-S19_0291 [Pacmanvirus S19]|nr:hypothetical protein PV-S19_0291 [Pacmanvirus S19]
MSIIPVDVVLHIVSYLHKSTITWTETAKYRKIKCDICGFYHKSVNRDYDHYTADIIDPINISTALALRLVSTDTARAIHPPYIHYKIGGDFGVSEYIRLMKYNFKLAKPFIYEKPTITKSNYEWDIETYKSSKNISFEKLRKNIDDWEIDIIPTTSYLQDMLKRFRNNFYGYFNPVENTDGQSVGITKQISNLYSGYNTEDSIIFPLWNTPRIEQVVGRAYRRTDHANLPVIGNIHNDLHRANLLFEQNLEPENVQPVPIINIKHKKQKRRYRSRKDMNRMNKTIQRKQKYQKNYR